MPVFEEDEFDKMKDPVFMKKAKKEALAKKKRLAKKKQEEIEELERSFYGDEPQDSHISPKS